MMAATISRGAAATVASPMVLTSTRIWLRLEAAAMFAAGLAIFGAAGGPWLLALPLLLVPDLSMVGYLHDTRTGAFTYNLIHNWATGVVVLGIGAWSGIAGVTIAGAILIAHTGMDRAIGYGLKSPESFHLTHLGRVGKASAQS
jgi:hypothetical protein